MAKISTQFELLEKYRKAQNLSVTAFAEALGSSRTSYYQWCRSTKIDVETLQTWARSYPFDWRGALAIDLLKLRNLSIPCVCQTQVGDNGPCPKHPVSIAEAA